MASEYKLPGQICIAGANGFIGKRLIEALSKENVSIRVLTRKDNNSFPEKVETIIGDLIDVDCKLDEFLKDCNVLFHCAREINNNHLMRALHVEGTKKLITSALKEVVKSNTSLFTGFN